MSRPTALVTGASRGIGKALAVALAHAGYDVAITARTVVEGTATAPENGAALPGSLGTTAALIAAAGARAVPLRMDLLDLDSLAPTVDEAVAGLGGHLDLLVNNAVWTGPGNDCRLVDSDPDDLVRRVTGNLTAHLLVTRAALVHMVTAGRGTVVGIGSAAGRVTPPTPAGQGGWSLAYAASKAGFHRIADVLAVEYGAAGIRALTVNPGFVATERVLAAGESLAFVARRGTTPEAVATAIVRLAHDPSVPNGAYVDVQDRRT